MTAVEQTYREHRPISALEPYLSCVWVQRVSPGADPYTHRTVPNGAVELRCTLGSVPQVRGPQTGPTVDTLTPGTTVVGVRFRPGAAPAALGVPASELVDVAVEVDALWGSDGARVGELLAEQSESAAAAGLERAILARLRDADRPDPVVAEAVRRMRPAEGSEVGDLASSLFMSERQLRRRCVAAIGLAPKVLQRMLRFQRFMALAHAREPAELELAGLAAAAGYADQPHLTRECLRLSGRSPRALLAEADEHCHGIHDHAASYGPLLH